MSVPWGRGFEQVSGDDYQMSVAGGGRYPGSMLGGGEVPRSHVRGGSRCPGSNASWVMVTWDPLHPRTE